MSDWIVWLGTIAAGIYAVTQLARWLEERGSGTTPPRRESGSGVGWEPSDPMTVLLPAITAAVDEMKEELRDRFGPLPEKLSTLFDILYLKVKAIRSGIKTVKEEDGSILIEKLSGKRVKIKIKGRNKIKLAELGIA